MKKMLSVRKFAVLFALALLLAACGAKTEAGKRYSMQGKVLALDQTAQTATIQHGKIGDWMDPMTMEYPVKPASEFQKLKVGEKITATVVVNDLKYYVTDVKPAQ